MTFSDQYWSFILIYGNRPNSITEFLKNWWGLQSKIQLYAASKRYFRNQVILKKKVNDKDTSRTPCLDFLMYILCISNMRVIISVSDLSQ